MTSRNRGAIAALALLMVITGCGGGSHRDMRAAVSPTAGASVSGSYNADQLTQALLTDIPGYERTGSPQWGEYGSLAAVQDSAQMQQAVKLDKPQCASSARAVAQDKVVQTAPSALVTFALARRQTATETLMAVGPDVAAQQVGIRVPFACRTFRVRVGAKWSTDTVVELSGPRVGEGSRMTGVTTVVGATTVRTWFVVWRSRGYLASITLFGVSPTRNEAARLARRAYQQAERILP